MKNTFLTLPLLLALACASPEKADLIIQGGTIYTVNEQQPVVEAVAVKGTKILFAGRQADAEKYRGRETRLIDLNGKVMTPGFIEGHGHILGLGYNEMNLDLLATTSFEEIIEKVREAATKAKPGQWIVGRGWHQDKWPNKPEKLFKGFPSHHELSRVSPNNPVYLRHASGHAGMANAYAMQLAGVNQISKEQVNALSGEGGEIIRDELGNPTGIFNERAQTLITNQIPETTLENDAQRWHWLWKRVPATVLPAFMTQAPRAKMLSCFFSSEMS